MTKKPKCPFHAKCRWRLDCLGKEPMADIICLWFTEPKKELGNGNQRADSKVVGL